MHRIDDPRFRTALQAVEASIAERWALFCSEHEASGPELAEIVLQNPAEFEWRVVDAALDQLTCAECGSRLGSGPVECTACEFANGQRYGAIEIDRSRSCRENSAGHRALRLAPGWVWCRSRSDSSSFR